ncbi:unnamed protein product [Choristocarpus tenellus]
MAWGEVCNCGDDCKCINCPYHLNKVTKAMDLLMKAVEMSTKPEKKDESLITCSGRTLDFGNQT